MVAALWRVRAMQKGLEPRPVCCRAELRQVYGTGQGVSGCEERRALVRMGALEWGDRDGVANAGACAAGQPYLAGSMPGEWAAVHSLRAASRTLQPESVPFRRSASSPTCSSPPSTVCGEQAGWGQVGGE